MKCGYTLLFALIYDADQQPVSAVLVFNCVDGDRLEAPPANGEGERIASLQDFGEPAVPLQTDLHVAPALLHS